MKALSIRAPWWWFILHAGKDIENRRWPTRHRGPLLIHASQWWDADEVAEDFADVRRGFKLPNSMPVVTLGDLRQAGGKIVGVVRVVDCIERSASPWFAGRYGFVLADRVAFSEPRPIRGRLGLFDVDPARDAG